MNRQTMAMTGKTFALLVLSMLVSACTGSASLEKRTGYLVDSRHVATAYNSRIRHLVLHYTDSKERQALDTLTGPLVSAHYVVPLPPHRGLDQPLVFQLVKESQRAWHAGKSAWRGHTNLNDTSIGIEIVNQGPLVTAHGRRWDLYPAEQIKAVIALSRDIIERHGIEPTDVVGHADIAPSRKIDPGPRFPWYQLYQAGIGAWPDDATIKYYRQRFRNDPPSLRQVQLALVTYGYALNANGTLDDSTRDVLRAFQMHFRPANHAGYPDPETTALLWALIDKYRGSQAANELLAKPSLPCRSHRQSNVHSALPQALLTTKPECRQAGPA
ncbi:N-acetylmuramoyl-L-alanine amidase [Halomonas shantousis]